jgi:hypothetical protein
MNNISSSTKEGTEGCNISFSEEQSVGERLLKELPKDWKVKFAWIQMMFFSDLSYEIDKETKTVDITYNKNLEYYSKELIKEIKDKINQL